MIRVLHKVKPAVMLLILCLIGLTSKASVSFSFDAISVTPSGSASIERNLSKLLTAINNAAEGGLEVPDFTGVNIEPGAIEQVNRHWREAAKYKVLKNSIITRCLQDMQGYQVRSIPVVIIPIDGTYTEAKNRELTVSFKANGLITGVRLARQLHEDREQFLTGSQTSMDARMRLEVLKWVEDFRSYYNEKNIAALEQIYSNDALIITGSVVRTRKLVDGKVTYVGKVKFKEKSKIEYIKGLKTTFKRNKYIHLDFDHISVMQSTSKDYVYGVILRQKWNSTTYKDTGWLFLVWDFSNPDAPQVLVRTWQPEDPEFAGVPSLEDFFIE